MDPEPGGPKTCGSGGSGSGSATLLSGHNTVPVPDGLIEAGRDDEILGGMELGAHHVVVVARQHGQAVPGLPVPDPDSLRIEIQQMTKLHVCALQEYR
jgi:hypothetical protein